MRSKNVEKQSHPQVPPPGQEAPAESQNVFTCPKQGCTKAFQRHSSLEKHLATEKCLRSLEKFSLLDLAKLGYKDKLEDGVGVVPTLKTNTLAESIQDKPLESGWALRSSKKSYRFNDQQKLYLNAKFDIGQTTGRKVNANDVARDMRRARSTSGERLFTVAEFLSPQQISAYFSRLSASIRKKKLATQDDLRAIEEEVNFANARESVLSSLSLQHPITYDQFNVCSLVRDNALDKIKLPLLQAMCKDLGLDVPLRPVRAKAHYKTLLQEAVHSCTCSQ